MVLHSEAIRHSHNPSFSQQYNLADYYHHHHGLISHDEYDEHHCFQHRRNVLQELAKLMMIHLWLMMNHLWPMMIHLWLMMIHLWPMMIHLWLMMIHLWLMMIHLWPMMIHLWPMMIHLWPMMIHLWPLYETFSTKLKWQMMRTMSMVVAEVVVVKVS